MDQSFKINNFLVDAKQSTGHNLIPLTMKTHHTENKRKFWKFYHVPSFLKEKKAMTSINTIVFVEYSTEKILQGINHFNVTMEYKI